MAFKIHVYMLNEHFSQEHADAHFGGKESENNKLLDWEDEMDLKLDIDKIDEQPKTTYYLRGTCGNNDVFEVPVKEMRVFEFSNKGELVAQIACSETLYEKHEIDEKSNTIHLTLKGEPYANPVPGIYIASLEFPKELIPRD